jgi:ABC-type taurine transport system ATPase subunit
MLPANGEGGSAHSSSPTRLAVQTMHMTSICRLGTAGFIFQDHHLFPWLTMVVLIAGISSYVGIRKVLKTEPFDIFMG